jgi:uncharacterized protein
MDALAEQIVARVQGVEGISALVLFGSRARGEGRADSDLDIAVLPDSGDAGQRRRLQSAVAVALAELAPEGRVDVVILDEAPELLRQRVLEHGRLLVCRDTAAWRALRVRTMREHGDREHFRRMLRQAQRRRLLEGRPSGRSGRALRALERARRLSR